MVEGAPLLREYGSKAHRGFESLSLRQIKEAPVAQLDRVFGYEPKGRRFESFRAHHIFMHTKLQSEARNPKPLESESSPEGSNRRRFDKM